MPANPQDALELQVSGPSSGMAHPPLCVSASTPSTDGYADSSSAVIPSAMRRLTDAEQLAMLMTAT